ncbi:hypothetical protein N7470_008362 [Penicillium chermesinum]|nr:hypothetical protein N7470_008362 [Penicillium chermesinum]
MSGEKVLEGILPVHKPQGVTSADVLRTLQKHFNPSKTFKPWLDAEKARLSQDPSYQKKRRRNKKPMDVKIGHGGTLDPSCDGHSDRWHWKGNQGAFRTRTIAWGKSFAELQRNTSHARRSRRRLNNSEGKSCSAHLFFSALRVDGKKLYEYARAGKMPPVEIKSRPVETVSLELVDFYEPGTHEFKWPEAEMTGDEKTVAEKLLDKDASLPITTAAAEETADQGTESSNKRKSPPPADFPKEGLEGDQGAAKKQKADGGEAQPVAPEPGNEDNEDTPATKSEKPHSQPPAVKLKMTVTSGFYVRSLAHDLGKALGSCGLMSSLVRSRQGDYELDPEKVLEYKDLEAGEEVWGPKVTRFLTEWEEKRAAKAASEAEK